MNKIRKRKSWICHKRRRKKGISVAEKLKKDFFDAVSETKHIFRAGLKRWDFFSKLTTPSLPKKRSKRTTKRSKTRARNYTRARVRSRKRKPIGFEKFKGSLQQRARDLSVFPNEISSFFNLVKRSFVYVCLGVIASFKRLVSVCAWLLEGFAVVLVYLGFRSFDGVKFALIFIGWISKWIIVGFMYACFVLIYILRLIYQLIAYIFSLIGTGIIYCIVFVADRFRRELALSAGVLGACILAGVVCFQFFFVNQKEIASFARSQEQFVAMASPGVELISSESVTTGSSPSGHIHTAPVATDSFCAGQCCNTYAVSMCPRMCAVPERVIPQTKEIAPCVLMATLRHTWGRGIGLDDGYTSIEQVLFPVELGTNIWPFLDFRLHGLDGGELAANVGVGYRYYSACRELAFGMNAYYDYRETSRHTRFSQFGIGFEILGKCWDLRLNGYFPIRETKLLKTCLWNYPGGYFIEKKKFEEAKRGVDLELGACLGSIDLFGCSCRTELACLNFYAAAGPYYYRGDKCDRRNIVGGKFRMRIESGRYFSVEGSVTRDSFYKTRFQVQLALHIPIGCCACDKGAERVLSQPVRRNEMIVIDEFCKWRWNY